MTTYLVRKTQRVERFARANARTPPAHASGTDDLAVDRAGENEQEIAKAIGVARKTVDAHRSNICRKLEIHGQYVLTRFAARHRAEI